MADRFTGQILADKYRLESLVTADDAGGVYSGVNVRLERPVLIKLLPSELAEDENVRTRFFDQARLQSHITNPNVLSVSDFGTAEDGGGYIVFEGSADDTLANEMRVRGRLPWREAVETARQIASALAAGHMANAIHGNLTPDKVLLTNTPDGVRTAKAFDFGSVNPIVSGEINGQSMADVMYLAPEQCSGSEVADSRSDIYALGVILYEMLAGQPPFAGEKPTDIMLKHIEEPPAPLSAFRQDLPPAIEPVVLKALAKDPDLRHQTAAEVEQELSGILHGGTAAAAATTGGNNLWKTAFIVLAGIALLSAFLIYATSSKQTNPATALQPDANGQPVQPINPATGAEEQSLALMPGALPESMSNANVDLPPGVLPGGDGYNPWASGVAPPAGAPPQYIGPGGQVYTIDPSTGSPFMPPDGGVILVPVPANTNTSVKPTQSPKPPANADTATTPVPDAATKPTPAAAKPTPAPTKAPAQKPPANKPPAGEADEIELN